MQKLPKKTSEMNTMDLYEYFKKGMINMAKQNFVSVKSRPEPAVFLGVKRSVLPKITHMIPQDIREQVMKNGASDDAIHVICLPLGIFFEDRGNDHVNDVGKTLARKLVGETIDQIRTHDYNGVMFTAFICEVFVQVKHLNNAKTVDELLNSKDYKRPSKDPEAQDKVIITLETQNSSEIIMFDIIENKETDYMEIINEESAGDNKSASHGLFGGLIHNGINTNHN